MVLYIHIVFVSEIGVEILYWCRVIYIVKKWKNQHCLMKSALFNEISIV